MSASFEARASLKDTVEALGVPHPEIGEVRVNGEPASLGSAIAEGATVDVFPNQPRELTEAPRFVLDGHLGRLAATLRMLGFDVWWQPDADDALLAKVSRDEGRVLLTRDVGLLKRSIVTDGAFMRATLPHLQAHEVVARFDLRRHARPFTRCMRCNGRLESVPAEEVRTRVPPRVAERQAQFSRCVDCGRIYWAGTHHQRMQRVVDELLAREIHATAKI